MHCFDSSVARAVCCCYRCSLFNQFSRFFSLYALFIIIHHSSYIQFCIIRLVIFVQLPVHNAINGKTFAFPNNYLQLNTYYVFGISYIQEPTKMGLMHWNMLYNKNTKYWKKVRDFFFKQLSLLLSKSPLLFALRRVYWLFIGISFLINFQSIKFIFNFFISSRYGYFDKFLIFRTILCKDLFRCFVFLFEKQTFHNEKFAQIHSVNL